MRQHADWISAYLDTIVSKSEAPERFHFWIAASIVGGALRRRVYLDMEAFSWYPNMFVVLVGPPGTVKKSTTINIGARILREVPNIHFGSDVVTWEAFIQQMEDAKDIFADGPPRGDRFDFDQTHKTTCALTCIVSEWGTFLDPRNYQMINMLTELYDGKTDIPLKKITKTQGDNTINNPFLNMIAGTTPDWMNDNFKGRFGGWGFSSRCIFLHCLAPERYIPFPDEVWKGTFKTAMDALKNDLIEISQLNGPMTITEEARAYGRGWYIQHVNRKRELDLHPNHDPWLSYYLARKFDHAIKLSICLSASRGDDLTITLADIEHACRRCDEVEFELSNIFGSGSNAQSRVAKLNTDVWRGVENIITKNGGSIPERAIKQYILKWMSFGEMQDFIRGLADIGVLGREIREDGTSHLIFGPEYQPQQANA